MPIYKCNDWAGSVFDRIPTAYHIDPDTGQLVMIGNCTPIIDDVTRVTKAGAHTVAGSLVWDGKSWLHSTSETDYDWYTETFTDSDGALQSRTTTDLTWNQVVGSMSVKGNQLECGTDGEGTAFARYYPTAALTDLGNTTDQEVGFRITNPDVIQDNSRANRWGTLLRYNTATDSGYAVMLTIATKDAITQRARVHVEFYKIDSGTVTLLNTFSNIKIGKAFASNEPLDVYFRVTGFRVSCFIGDKEIAFVNRGMQEYFHNTGWGLIGDNNGYATGSRMLIDNVWATPISNLVQAITPTWNFLVSSSAYTDPAGNAWAQAKDYLAYVRWETANMSWYSRGKVTFPGTDPDRIRYLFPRKDFNQEHVFYDTFTDTNGVVLSAHTPDVGSNWSTRSVGIGGSINIQANTAQIQYGGGTPNHWLALSSVSTPPSWHNYLRVNVRTDLLDDWTEAQSVKQGLLVRYLNSDDLIVAYMRMGTGIIRAGQSDEGKQAYLEIAKVENSSSDTNEKITVLASVETCIPFAATSNLMSIQVWDLNGSIIAVNTANIVGNDMHDMCCVDYYDETVAYWEQQGLREYYPELTWSVGIWCHAAGVLQPRLQYDFFEWYRDGAIEKQVDTSTDVNESLAEFVPILGFTSPNSSSDTGIDFQGCWWNHNDEEMWIDAVVFENFIIPSFYFYNIHSDLPAMQQFAIWTQSSGTITSVLGALQQEAFWLNIANLQQTLGAFTQSLLVEKPRSAQVASLLPWLVQDVNVINPVSIASLASDLGAVTQSAQASYDYVIQVLQSLPTFQANLQAASNHTGTIATYLASLFNSAQVFPENSLDVESILGAMVSSSVLLGSSTGQIQQQLTAMSAEALTEQAILTTIASSLSSIRQSILTANLHVASIDSALPAARTGLQSLLLVSAQIDQAIASIQSVSIGATDYTAQIESSLAWIEQAAQSAADYAAQIDSTLGYFTVKLTGSLPIGTEVAQALSAINQLAQATGREFKIRQELVALNTSSLVQVMMDANTQSLLGAMTADAQALAHVSSVINTGLAYIRALATVQVVDDSTIRSVLSAMVNAGQIKVEERAIYELLLKVFSAKSIELSVHATDEIELKVTKDEMRHL